jgi:hypothetical protein
MATFEQCATSHGCHARVPPQVGGHSSSGKQYSKIYLGAGELLLLQAQTEHLANSPMLTCIYLPDGLVVGVRKQESLDHSYSQGGCNTHSVPGPPTGNGCSYPFLKESIIISIIITDNLSLLYSVYTRRLSHTMIPLAPRREWTPLSRVPKLLQKCNAEYRST